MSGRISGARSTLATALGSLVAGDVPVEVHAYPTGAVQPPCLLLLPGSPYVDPSISWSGATVGIDVRVVLNNRFGPDSVAMLDDLVEAVIDALIPINVGIGQVPPPTEDAEQGVLIVDIPTTVTT